MSSGPSILSAPAEGLDAADVYLAALRSNPVFAQLNNADRLTSGIQMMCMAAQASEGATPDQALAAIAATLGWLIGGCSGQVQALAMQDVIHGAMRAASKIGLYGQEAAGHA